MFEEMKPRFILSLMGVASIVSISILLQAIGNVLLTSIVMQLIFYTVLPLGFCSYYFKKHNMELRQIVFFRGTVRWLLPVSGLTVLVLAFSMSIYCLLLRALMPIAPAAVEFALTRQPLPDALWYLAAAGFIAAVIAPVAEEFVFRGVILNRLLDLFGFWKGLGLSSLIFGIFHINFFGAFLFAVMASLLYLKTGNLLAAIVLHIANNTIAVYQSFVNPSFPEWLMVVNIDDLYTKTVPNLLVLFASSALLLFIITRIARDVEIK